MTTPRVPELCAGDCLTRDEFERRYAAMPELKKAELVDGVVYMGSPVRFLQHGLPHADWLAWLLYYREATPGVLIGDNVTVRLDQDNEPQPDLVQCIPAHADGTTRVSADGFLEGPPELVVEIAASSVSYDLHQKKDVYRRSGVREYVVHRVLDGAIDWFALEAGRYVPLVPNADGLLKSRVFPGLWLDPDALLRADLTALRAAVERGCAGPAHAEFARYVCPRRAT